jgi:hypothetical protein
MILSHCTSAPGREEPDARLLSRHSVRFYRASFAGASQGALVDPKAPFANPAALHIGGQDGSPDSLAPYAVGSRRG